MDGSPICCGDVCPKCSAATGESSARRIGLAGLDGTVYLDHFAGCRFLKNAAEHTEGAAFPVPFSRRALEVVRLFVSCEAINERRPEAPALNFNPLDPSAPATVSTTIKHTLEELPFEVLFEVLRAANYLECEGLLDCACRVASRVFRLLRVTPTVLGSVLGLDSKLADAATAAAWADAVDEPVLTPPAADGVDFYDDHRIRDEDALALTLAQCDAATLRVLKGFSPYVSAVSPSLFRCFSVALLSAPLAPRILTSSHLFPLAEPGATAHASLFPARAGARAKPRSTSSGPSAPTTQQSGRSCGIAARIYAPRCPTFPSFGCWI